jgi:eukaryotic-like serine/threonine-protein kinase
MGVVYLAIETGLNRLVALKVLRGALGPDGGAGPRRRWLREARAVSSVRHPNVVPLYRFGEADGWFFLVLEYVSGGTLKQRLAEPLTAHIAAGLVEKIACAVGYLHGRGLLHLDLKPSNILLDCEVNSAWDRVTPRIADFGLAHSDSDASASQTSLGGLRGTPSYMAPEQATASPAGVGAAADIHALGGILYELLTGRPPFQGASTLETLDQVRGQNPVPPRRLNPKIPRDLEIIALKCLEKNPSRRYTSAKGLADDLTSFLEGRPIQARPVSVVEHAWSWCRRQPVIASLAATLFLTVIGSFLGLLALLRRSETDYQVASRSLAELSAAVLDEREESAGFFSDKHFKTLELARSLENELAKQYPRDSRGLKRLAMIDTYLANFYARNGKYDHARSLKEESIRSSQAYLALRPDDMAIRQLTLDSARGILGFVSGSKEDRLYELWDTRAIAMLERLKAAPDVQMREVFLLSFQHRARANAFMFSGESARARRELERDLDLLRSVRGGETEYREFVLIEALTLAALGRWSGELTSLEPSVRSWQAITDVKLLESCLAELTSQRLGWQPSLTKSRLIIPEDLPSETWTERVISTMRSDATTFQLGHTRIPQIAWNIRVPCANALGWQRRVGNLGDAHPIADRLLALAEGLTRSYPDQAASYMLLSEGYVQKAKNAYREDEDPVIERWERKALDAALRAATLEPENEEALGLVKDRRARLDKIMSTD